MRKEAGKRHGEKNWIKQKLAEMWYWGYLVLVNKSHILKCEYLNTTDYGFPAQDPDGTS